MNDHLRSGVFRQFLMACKATPAALAAALPAVLVGGLVAGLIIALAGTAWGQPSTESEAEGPAERPTEKPADNPTQQATGTPTDRPTYKVYQFPPHQMPRIDGDASDWDAVPASYALTSAHLKDTARGTKNDPANLDVSVKVGWVKGLNRLYFLYEAYDDYWDFKQPGMHNDIFEVIVDGNASGGPITGIADPTVKHGTWASYIKQGVTAQNYHVFTPAHGKNWAMIWGCQPWALAFPWSNAAQSYDFKHGESGHYTLEFWITPFDHADFSGPDQAVVSRLAENQEIGLSWVILDYDDENAPFNGYRSFNNLSDDKLVHSDADLLRRFRLMPLEDQSLMVDWGFEVIDLDQRTVAFHDRSSSGVTRWHWDFGDGTSSSDPNPVHRFQPAKRPGGRISHVVTLTVERSGEVKSQSRVWELVLP